MPAEAIEMGEHMVTVVRVREDYDRARRLTPVYGRRNLSSTVCR